MAYENRYDVVFVNSKGERYKLVPLDDLTNHETIKICILLDMMGSRHQSAHGLPFGGNMCQEYIERNPELKRHFVHENPFG